MVNVAMYGKGGIGKSTMSSNLTAALTDKGYKVLQIGCDPKHDSTRLLLDGEIKSTILEYMKDTPPSQRRLEDVVSEGYGGCLCTEAGGPEPGVGCAGRGIISSFELLQNLGLDSIERDVTLYDVLGDVVCGGFAVPLRNEYADVVFIVTSGEYMAIYAANNILRGICNYDPNRVGGLIFNSRGDPEEKNRIDRFSKAVGIPIVAEFDRSELFMTAEESGKTVVERYPESDIADNFRILAENVMGLKRYRANYLDEAELERCVLGRNTVKRKQTKANLTRTISDRPKRKYASRNVMNDEPYGGCAFSGAQSTCASVKGLVTILHSPTSCAQFTFQTVSNTFGRYQRYHLPVPSFSDPCVKCTRMNESDMIFGGATRLEKEIMESIQLGNRNLAVITSCPAGIIGDDVKGVVSKMCETYPEVRIALIECDGSMNGDFIQGVIDAGIELCETFSKECERTPTVNLIGSKPMALDCMNSIDMIRGLLERIGVEVNCILPGCDSIESIERMGSATMNIMADPDHFAVQLCTYMFERFGIETCPIPVLPGISGTRMWLGYVANAFGRGKEFDALMNELSMDFRSAIAPYRHLLNGKRVCMVSATKNIDWIIEALDEAGVERLRTVVLNRSDYSNDLNIRNEAPNISFLDTMDVSTERKIIEDMTPDLVISTVHLGLYIQDILIPLIQIPDPLAGTEFIKRISLMLSAPKNEGWREDVVRT